MVSEVTNTMPNQIPENSQPPIGGNPPPSAINQVATPIIQSAPSSTSSNATLVGTPPPPLIVPPGYENASSSTPPNVPRPRDLKEIQQSVKQTQLNLPPHTPSPAPSLPTPNTGTSQTQGSQAAQGAPQAQNIDANAPSSNTSQRASTTHTVTPQGPRTKESVIKDIRNLQKDPQSGPHLEAKKRLKQDRITFIGHLAISIGLGIATLAIPLALGFVPGVGPALAVLAVAGLICATAWYTGKHTIPAYEAMQESKSFITDHPVDHAKAIEKRDDLYNELKTKDLDPDSPLASDPFYSKKLQLDSVDSFETFVDLYETEMEKIKHEKLHAYLDNKEKVSTLENEITTLQAAGPNNDIENKTLEKDKAKEACDKAKEDFKKLFKEEEKGDIDSYITKKYPGKSSPELLDHLKDQKDQLSKLVDDLKNRWDGKGVFKKTFTEKALEFLHISQPNIIPISDDTFKQQQKKIAAHNQQNQQQNQANLQAAANASQNQNTTQQQPS